MSSQTTQEIFYPIQDWEETLLDIRSPELVPAPALVANTPMQDFQWRFTTPWDNLSDEEIKTACGVKPKAKSPVQRCIEVLQAGDYYIPEPVCVLEEQMEVLEATWTKQDPRLTPVALAYTDALLNLKLTKERLEAHK